MTGSQLQVNISSRLHSIALTYLAAITDHWSTKFLYFANNDGYNPRNPNRDRLSKVKPLLNYLNKKSQEVYYLSKKISIDEQQLLLHKEKCFLQAVYPEQKSPFWGKILQLV